jgi:hypothetical protein
MNLTNDGKVGVGTGSGITETLTVMGNILLRDDSGSKNALIRAQGSNTNIQSERATTSKLRLETPAGGGLTVWGQGGGQGSNVGIGTDDPSAKLEVAGQVKITGGAPGAGKVLTSDAAGLATWESPGAGSQGPQGKQGATGAQGSDGEQGPAGPSGTSSWVDGTGQVTTTAAVGIGTVTTPTALIDASAPGEQHFRFGSTNSPTKVFIGQEGGLTWQMYQEIHFGHGWKIGGWPEHNFRLQHDSSTRLFIDDSGKVGIGTDSPGSRLAVVGLPTSDVGLSAGSFYWEYPSGTLKIKY